jgi:hypothetical protein
MAEEDFSKHVSPEQWKNTTFDGESCRWLPIIQADASKTWIGLTELGTWVVENRRGEVAIMAGAALLSFFPFFAGKQGDFRTALLHALEEKRLPIELAQTCPIQAAVRYALTSESEYWQGLAIEWVETGTIDKDMLAALDTVAASGISQKNRHRAQRLLARTRKRKTMGSGPYS